RFDARRLKSCPTTIGRTPPSFFVTAINLPPNRIDFTGSGTPPATIMLTRAVIAVSNELDCPSLVTMSLTCWGVRPSGPPVDPGGKDRVALRTAASLKVIGAQAGSTGGMGRRSAGAGDASHGEPGAKTALASPGFP